MQLFVFVKYYELGHGGELNRFKINFKVSNINVGTWLSGLNFSLS